MTTPEVTDATVLVRRSSVLAATVDGEIVMLDPEQATYFALDAIAARVWELIEQPRTVGDIVATLLGDFEVDEPTCRAEVVAFVQQLSKATLVDLQ